MKDHDLNREERELRIQLAELVAQSARAAGDRDASEIVHHSAASASAIGRPLEIDQEAAAILDRLVEIGRTRRRKFLTSPDAFGIVPGLLGGFLGR